MTGPSGEEIKLRAELTDVLDGPLAEVFKDGLRSHTAKFPVLADAVRSVLSEEMQPDLNLALLQVMRKAISSIDDILLPYSGKTTAIKTREIASVLCGLSNNLELREKGGRYTYDGLREEAIKRADFKASPSTFQRRIATPIKTMLADVLINRQVELRALEPRASSLEVSVSDCGHRERLDSVYQNILGESAKAVVFVDRSEYISKLRGAIDSGQKIVCLHGPPGIGKTVLAEQTAKAMGSRKVITLRTGDNAALWGDLVEALIFEGFEPTDWSQPYCRAIFRNRIAEKTNAEVVVIDNVSDLGILWQLVTQSPTVPIIVTSRVPLADPAIKNIELDDFTPEQAFRLVSDNIADCHADTAHRLGSACGYRPLALSLAIHFLKESPAVTPTDLIYEISRDIVVGLEMLATPNSIGSSLVRLYQTMLNSIAEDSLAVEFLDAFLAVAGTTGISEYAVAGFLMRQSSAFGNETYLHAGVRKLASLGLVRTQDLRIVMHPLSYEVLRHLRGLPVFQAEAKFMKALFDIPPEIIDSRAGPKDMLWIYKQDLLIGSTLIEGWECMMALDEKTWLAIRHREQTRVVVRYEIRQGAGIILELDCSTGIKRQLSREEIVEFNTALYMCYMQILAVNLRGHTEMNNPEGITLTQMIVDSPGLSDSSRDLVRRLSVSEKLVKIGSFYTIAWQS